MTATNHTITGVLIGLSVHEPVLAVVLAVLSHFVLDALPHFANPKFTGKKLAPILAVDAFCASLILLSLLILRPDYWVVAVVCGIAAASPDLMWFPLWLRQVLRKKPKTPNSIMKFHAKIQWAEKPYNYPYEVVWLLVSLVTLVKII